MNLFNYILLALAVANPYPESALPHQLSDPYENSARRETESRWQRIETKDQDVSILMPTQPEVYTKPGGFSFSISGEEIKTDRLGLAYGGGVFYSVEVYETSHPTIALQELLHGTHHSKASKRDVTINGFKGKEFIYNEPDTYTVFQYFSTKKHICVIKAVTRRGDNSAIRYFLTSLRLGNVGLLADDRVPPDVQALIDTYVPSQSAASSTAAVLKPTDADRKAILMWRPDSIYSRFAPLKNLKGLVKLRMILTGLGEVTDVEVLEGDNISFHDGIVESIKALKFLPAEKDGRPVSTRVTMNYDFNASYHRSIAR